MQLDADLAPVQKQEAAAAFGIVMAAFVTESLEFRVGGNHFFKIGAPFGHKNGQQIFQAQRFFLPPVQVESIDDCSDNGRTERDPDHPQIEKPGRSESETQKVGKIQ